MGKLVVLLFLLFSSAAYAQIDTACLFNKGTDRKIYRDSSQRVVCVNYGGTKAVQYFYNDTSKNMMFENRILPPASLINKKFYGFRHIPNRAYDPSLDLFYTGVLKELLMEIRELKSLPDIIAQFYPDSKKQHEFVDSQINGYFTKTI